MSDHELLDIDGRTYESVYRVELFSNGELWIHQTGKDGEREVIVLHEASLLIVERPVDGGITIEGRGTVQGRGILRFEVVN